MDKETYEQYAMQDKLQQAQMDSNTSMYAPSLQDQAQQAQAVLVTETNPSKVVDEVIMTLKNMEFDPKTNQFIQIGQPLLNQEGIDQVKFILRSHVHQGAILSHMEEKQINRIVEKIANDLVDDLAVNWQDYGIENKLNLDNIANAVVFSIYYTLMRAFGQNEKNWLKGITVENISGRSNIPMPKKGGIWEKFKI